MPEPEYADTSYEENNITINKKSATSSNESSPTIPYKRSATTVLTVNQS